MRDPLFESALIELMPDMQRFARYLTKGPGAEDLVQDTLVKALKSSNTFDMATNIKSWLFTIMRHHYINGLRKNKYISEDDLESLHVIDEHVTDSVDVIHLQELRTTISGLTPAYRNILLLRAWGFHYNEMARILRAPVGTIKSRLHRAMVELELRLAA